jgi:hypothetical protein
MADRKARFTQAVWEITEKLRDAKAIDNALASSLEITIVNIASFWRAAF